MKKINIKKYPPFIGSYITPKKLLIAELARIAWMEQYSLGMLDTLEAISGTGKLTEVISNHYDTVLKHIERLKYAFAMSNQKFKSKKSGAAKSLLKGVRKILTQTKENSLIRDINILFILQKIDHYKMASYSNIIELSLALKQEEIAKILAITLNEENEMDEMLSYIEKNQIHFKANQAAFLLNPLFY